MTRHPDTTGQGGERDGKRQPERDSAKKRAASEPAVSKQPPLAVLAHELKTPISAIAAAADVMRQEQFGPLGNDKYRSYISDIHSSALLMLAVIDRMMAERSGDETSARTEPVAFDVRATLVGLCSAMQPLAQASGVVIRLIPRKQGSDDPLMIIADEVSVTQILLNLINNAIKFTPIGGTVDVDGRALEDGSVGLSVVDTGDGMTAEQIESVILGENVPTSTGPIIGRGLGIGLPLVRALSEANGAEFKLSSKGPSQGTRADVTFSGSRVSGR